MVIIGMKTTTVSYCHFCPSEASCFNEISPNSHQELRDLKYHYNQAYSMLRVSILLMPGPPLFPLIRIGSSGKKANITLLSDGKN